MLTDHAGQNQGLDWSRNFRMGRDTLWRLSTNIVYRSISHLFSVGLFTACMITQETVSTNVRVLMSCFIQVPRGTDLRDIVNGFRDRWGFPQCAGAIDGTHVPIIAPHVNKADYYNRKGHYSVILQAVVDHKLQLWDINVGGKKYMMQECLQTLHFSRKASLEDFFHCGLRDSRGLVFPY